MKRVAKKKIIHSAERFSTLDIRKVDNKGRISLSNKALHLGKNVCTAKRYAVLVAKDGDILLRPMDVIPARETWIYKNPDVLESIRKGLNEAKEGKFEQVEDLDKFLDNL